MDSLTVREALPSFYAQYHLEPNGGVDQDVVKVALVKGITLYLPNVAARKKVVLKHDIHHLITGYSALMKGEMEIGAWELSTGNNNWVAFSLNTYSIMMGVFFNLPGIWKAWVLGRHTSNLYQEKYRVEDLLHRSVHDLKAELGLLNVADPKFSVSAFFSFAGFLVLGAVFSLLSIVLVPFMLLYTVFISIRSLWKKH